MKCCRLTNWFLTNLMFHSSQNGIICNASMQWSLLVPILLLSFILGLCFANLKKGLLSFGAIFMGLLSVRSR